MDTSYILKFPPGFSSIKSSDTETAHIKPSKNHQSKLIGGSGLLGYWVIGLWVWVWVWVWGLILYLYTKPLDIL